MYRFRTEHRIKTDLREAWKSFSSPHNLALITPKEMDFRICLGPNDRHIYDGMHIHYRLKPLLNLPVNWTTEIVNVKEGECFTDVQRQGPYKKWEHTHSFKATDDGVLMTDEIQYELPFGIFGRLAHWLVVRQKIKAIFNYRRQIINQLFK